MDQKDLPEFKAGDALSAGKLMELRNRILRLRLTTGQNSGIVLTESITGTAIRVQFPSDRYVGIVASGDITARVGTTPGTGFVDIQIYNPLINELEPDGTQVEVLNFSAVPPTGIPAGKYCWVQEDTDGNYWVISVEC